MKKFWKVGIVILGAMLGYGYYYFIGCRSGVCPISSNPYISIGYGALLGFIVSMGRSSKTNNKQEKQEKDKL